MFKKRNFIHTYIIDNKVFILLFILMLLIGCILGVIIAKCISQVDMDEILNYIKSTNTLIVKGEYEASNYEILKSTVSKVLVYFTVIIVLGCSIFFSTLIYLVPLYKGLSIGISVSLLLMLLGKIKGNIYVLIGMFLPNVILIIGLIVVSIMWIKFGKNILKKRDLYGIKQKICGNIIKTAVVLFLELIVLIPVEILSNRMLVEYIKII